MTRQDPGCALCGIEPSERICNNPQGKNPPFCPTVNFSNTVKSAVNETCNGTIKEFALNASIQESEAYSGKELGYAKLKPAKSRIEEIMDFAKRMNYRKLGLAFCMGLRSEAKAVEKLFSDHGFEMVSVVCKVGGEPKESLGIKGHEKVRCAEIFEAMCNPVAQAEVLNEAGAEFNILLGLCVGHDSMFFKYATAPCTVLAVKDRLLGHNPMAAIYNLDSYYRGLKA